MFSTMVKLILILASITYSGWYDYYPKGWQSDASHLIVPVLATIFTNEVLYNIGVRKPKRTYVSFLLPTILCLTKEVYDENSNGYFDPRDMAFNSLGLAIGLVVIY